MADKVRHFDWSSTPLGPADRWPAEMQSWTKHILESGFPAAIVARKGLVTIYNDAFAPILGQKPPALGRSFAEIWSEVWDDIGPIAERAFAGQATFIEDFPLTIIRQGQPEEAWFTFCYSPLRLADGQVVAMMDTVVETTGTVRARRQLELLNREVTHRLKNSMTVVQAVAQQTLKDVRGTPSVSAFLKRIAAIAKAHDHLLDRSGASRSLRDVITAALSPLDGLHQIDATGPELEVGSQTSMALAMMMFELATNAMKYGALSVPDGRVAVTWQRRDDSFALQWCERGGPPVVEPKRTGFGWQLVDRGLGYGSAISRRYPSAGLEVEIRAPLQIIAR